MSVRGCVACLPGVFDRIGPRQGEGHFAVRFDDARLPVRIFLDGAQVDHAVEVQAGANGWVIRYERAAGICHHCPCKLSLEGIEMEYLEGDVRVEIVRPVDDMRVTC